MKWSLFLRGNLCKVYFSGSNGEQNGVRCWIVVTRRNAVGVGETKDGLTGTGVKAEVGGAIIIIIGGVVTGVVAVVDKGLPLLVIGGPLVTRVVALALTDAEELRVQMALKGVGVRLQLPRAATVKAAILHGALVNCTVLKSGIVP